jgi:NADPH:quinone reductase-like Zn-dependent oxidoreductase
MKRVVDNHLGGPEVLRVVEDDDSRPGPGEVCVRALTAGVGPGECCQGDKVAGRPVRLGRSCRSCLVSSWGIWLIQGGER